MTNTAARALKILLKILGWTGLLALVPVFVPMSWMAATHRWLGLGEMPIAPIVEYLARSISALYAVFGGLCVVVATDLDRYRPLVRFLGIAFALLGFILTGVDLILNMPWWWLASEGPPGVVVGALIYYLAGPDSSRSNTSLYQDS